MVSFIRSNGKISVRARINWEFNDAAKQIGGRWNPTRSAWEFDEREEEAVRKLCLKYHGEDGITSNLCTLKIEWTDDESKRCKPLTVHGRTIACAKGRDSGALPSEGVILLEGEFDSGGSYTNWTTTADEGTVALVRDFPREAAEIMILSEHKNRKYYIENEHTISVDIEKLKEERTRLIIRIEEIDSLLAAGSG